MFDMMVSLFELSLVVAKMISFRLAKRKKMVVNRLPTRD